LGPYVVPTFRGMARRDALDLGIYVPTALGTSPELKSIGGAHVASWQKIRIIPDMHSNPFTVTLYKKGRKMTCHAMGLRRRPHRRYHRNL
jgi:hypothetical protein